MAKVETKEEVKNTPKLKDEILELSKSIEKGLKLDAKTGVITAEEGLYEKNLPEGLTMDNVKAVTEYNTNFVAASSHAVGKVSVDAMSSHKKLERTSVEIKMGVNDLFSATMDRSISYPNPQGDSGEKIVKYGVIKPDYDVRAGRNGGQLKVARRLISELAAEQLK